MNQRDEPDQPYKGQKFTSFEHLKKYLEEYGQKNYVKFWIRSSHTRNSQKSKISKTMNPDLKYVSVKFACIFGGEKIRCRGSGIRKSSTYRNLGCPCMINAVVGEDGNHVKLDTVILEHNHALCKTLYDSLKRTKRKSEQLKCKKEFNESEANLSESLVQSESFLSDVQNLRFSTGEEMLGDFKGISSGDKRQSNNDCLKDIEDKYGKIVKILVINSENKNNQLETDSESDKLSIDTWNFNTRGNAEELPEICRLCLSAKDKLSPIFNPNFPLESTVLSFKIMGCASIEISCNDGLPNNICTTCEANLDLAYNFRITCEKSDSILRETYGRTKTFIIKKDSENYVDDENYVSYENYISDEKYANYASYVDEENPNNENYMDHKISNDENSNDYSSIYENSNDENSVEENSSDENSNNENSIEESSAVENSNYETSSQEALTLCTEEESQESQKPDKVSSQEPLHFHFVITCPICASGFQNHDSMLEHLGTHTDDETFLLACNMCRLVCPSVKDLQEHMRKHLKDVENKERACVGSEMSFGNVEKLKVKVEGSCQESKSQEKKEATKIRYLCNVCGKSFVTKDRFQAHRNMHEGLRPHVCLKCGRGFADRKNLHQHYDVVHLRKVRYECPVCQRKFYTRTKMRSHMTMHSGDKPFQCDVCNRSFRLKMNMNKHRKTHTKDRPYQCDKCNAAFLEKNLLKRHSYKHGGIRPFRCPVCGHGFSAKFAFKKHLKDSKCRGLVIADPESYQWVGVDEPERNPEDEKCVVVYKTEEGDELQGDSESIDLKIL